MCYPPPNKLIGYYNLSFSRIIAQPLLDSRVQNILKYNILTMNRAYSIGRVNFGMFQWLLREFFGRKVTFFLIYISKDPHDSGDHFNIKISVVGARCVGGKGKKLIKKSNKCHLTRDVIDDVTLMNHTSYESP